MRGIVQHAYQSVPFYHRLLEANSLKPTDIRSVSDLSRIPVVTRKDFQLSSKSKVSRWINPTNCREHKTSGSTGVPVTVLTDQNAVEENWAVSLRQFFECGGRLRDKQVRLRGRGGILPHSINRPFSEYLGLLRTEWITISDEITDTMMAFLSKYDPDVMIGYPGFFQMLTEKVDGEIDPRIIFGMGETLSDRCRDSLHEAFEARIIDSYGCTETGDIAWECPQSHDTGYHINADSVIVEFVKNGETVGPGEEGDIVLTGLLNYAMPFIRYSIGDVGVPSDEPCSCGRTLPLMKSIKGRADDFLVLPAGKRISPLGILNMENFIDVAEYRVVQERKDLVEVWLKMSKDYRKDAIKKCVTSIAEVLGEDVEVIPRIVDEIPRDNSGKLRRVISRLAIQ